jgi:hypothetical protein
MRRFETNAWQIFFPNLRRSETNASVLVVALAGEQAEEVRASERGSRTPRASQYRGQSSATAACDEGKEHRHVGQASSRQPHVEQPVGAVGQIAALSTLLHVAYS